MKKKLEQFKLPADLAAQLKAYSEASGLDKTEIVITALRDQMASGTERLLQRRVDSVRALTTNSTSPDQAATAGLKLAVDSFEAASPIGKTSPPRARGRRRSDARQFSSTQDQE